MTTTTSDRPRGLSDLNPDLLKGYARRGLLGEALAWARRHLTGVHSAALCQALSEAYQERDRARERALELDARLLAEQARSQEAIRIRAQEPARLLEEERLEYLRLRDAASLGLELLDVLPVEGPQANEILAARHALRTALRLP